MPLKTSSDTITLRAVIHRKHPGLPAYVEIPSALVGPWGLAATTTVLASLDGSPAQRRSLKRWDADRWFIDIPRSLLDRAALSVGKEVDVALSIASTELPAEITDLLRRDPEASARWDALSPSRRRAIREHVGAAKRAETRRRRAAAALAPRGGS